MGMVVRTNTMATNAYRSLSCNQGSVAKSLEKLSSGFRINRAGDDAAGLAISEKMKAQIKGLEQASANSQDGISLIQTAEGATQEIHSMLNRMVELATKSANGTIQDNVDREAIQKEIDDLNSEISRIAQSTNFNGINLLDGSLSSGTVNAKLTTAAGATVSGAQTAAVAFTGTYTMDAAHTAVNLSFKDAGGNTVTLAATGITAGDSADALTKLKAADGAAYEKLTAAYDIKADATAHTITFTAKKAGADGLVQANSGAAATAPGNIAGATSGANAKSTITLGGAMAAGDKVTIGGKTYTMAAATNADKGEFADFAALKAQAEASGEYTVAAAAGIDGAGDTIVITATKAGGAGLSLQVGDTNADYNHVSVSVDDLSATGLGLSGIDVSSQAAAGNSIQTIKDAINKVSTNRANLGSLQNRLEYTINNLDTTVENMSAANSRIRDTDMAKEMMNYTKMNILTQSAQAMLAQANQQPQAILQLLQ